MTNPLILLEPEQCIKKIINKIFSELIFEKNLKSWLRQKFSEKFSFGHGNHWKILGKVREIFNIKKLHNYPMFNILRSHHDNFMNLQFLSTNETSPPSHLVISKW